MYVMISRTFSSVWKKKINKKTYNLQENISKYWIYTRKYQQHTLLRIVLNYLIELY